jgi:hypothetical protein
MRIAGLGINGCERLLKETWAAKKKYGIAFNVLRLLVSGRSEIDAWRNEIY